MSQPTECQYCGESIAAGTGRCPHCGEHLGPRDHRWRGPALDMRLRAAGAIQVVLGGLTAFMVPCMGFSLVLQSSLPPAQRQSVAASVVAVAIYALVAAFLIATGVGAWRHRRWARPVMLSVAAPGLVMGAAALAATAIVYPVMFEAGFTAASAGGTPAPAPPPGFLTAVMVMTVVIGGVFYVGIPGLLLLLYWSASLRTLCEEVDPTPRWTDGVPIPVLATALWLGLFGLGSLSVPAYGVVPLFGVLLTGWKALVFALGFAGASAGLALAVFRRHPLGWFGTLALVVVFGASHVVTFSRLPLIDLYRAMDMPPAQLQLMESVDLTPMSQAALWIGGVVLVVLLGFVVYLRRYFTGADVVPASS